MVLLQVWIGFFESRNNVSVKLGQKTRPPFPQGTSVVLFPEREPALPKPSREDSRGPMFSIDSVTSSPFEPTVRALVRKVTEGSTPPGKI